MSDLSASTWMPTAQGKGEEAEGEAMEVSPSCMQIAEVPAEANTAVVELPEVVEHQLVSIDPGLKNMGVAVGRVKVDNAQQKVTWIIDARRTRSIQPYDPVILGETTDQRTGKVRHSMDSMAIQTCFSHKFRQMFPDDRKVRQYWWLIEEAFFNPQQASISHRICMDQVIFSTWLSSTYGLRPILLRSKAVKQGVRGPNRGEDWSANKKWSREFIHKLLGEEKWIKLGKPNDHTCDALVQLYYFICSTFGEPDSIDLDFEWALRE